MSTSQMQLKIRPSDRSDELYASKGADFDERNEEYPSFYMSEETEQKLEAAMKDYNAGKSTKVNDISEFFQKL